MHRPRVFAGLISAALLLGGCAGNGPASSTPTPEPPSTEKPVPTAAPSTAATAGPTPVATTDPAPVSTTDPLPAPSTRRTATRVRSSEPSPAPNPMVSDVSDAGGAVPACGYEQPSLASAAPDATPAPDTCQFTGGSPACAGSITRIVDGDDVRDVEPTTYPLSMIVSAFARWGGERGAAMCFAELSDQSVTMTNGVEGIRVLHTANPIVFVGRTTFARSGGLRGVVAADVTSVVVRDPARPQGVPALLIPVNAGNGDGALPPGAKPAQILLTPVSSGPATVTAYDSAGAELGSVTVP